MATNKIIAGAPKKQCDLIMKGGLTSGIVYPSAIFEIAKVHKLVNIGGASAGAIAAVTAAAAEYRRQKSTDKADSSGFTQLSEVPNELGGDLIKLFQPSPEYEAVFNFALAFQKQKKLKDNLSFLKTQTDNEDGSQFEKIEKKLRSAKRAVRSSLWKALRVGLVLTSIPFIIVAFFLSINGAWGWFCLTVLLGLCTCIFVSMRKLWSYRPRNLEKHNFGLCTGLTQANNNGHPALTNWLSDQIDSIAWGAHVLTASKRKPLLLSDLEEEGVAVKAMTTDLSSGRPYELPLQTRIHYFKPSEFKKLFPKYILNYLIDASPKTELTRHGLLYQLPVGSAMPVIMIARMSLSFPVLISAIPLYRRDYSQKTDNGKYVFKRCFFSDGGISSNFPVHFFDELLPKRPTFGISLGTFDPDNGTNSDRIFLPRRSLSPGAIPMQKIDTLGGFIGSIVNTAKDWQDTLQSRLPGYAERVVTIRLDPNREGGLNLDMGEETISVLKDLGTEAGQRLVEEFNPEKHRYRRALTALSQVEITLANFAQTFSSEDQNGGLEWSDILTEYDDSSIRQSKTWRATPLQSFASAIVKEGTKANKKISADKAISTNKTLSKVDAGLRLTASADRVPQKREDP